MVEDRSSNRDSVIEGSSSAGSISEASGTHKVTAKIERVTIDNYRVLRSYWPLFKN